MWLLSPERLHGCRLSSPLLTSVWRFSVASTHHSLSWDKAVFQAPESLKVTAEYKRHPYPKPPTIPATSFQNLCRLFSEHGYTHNILVQMHTLTHSEKLDSQDNHHRTRHTKVCSQARNHESLPSFLNTPCESNVQICSVNCTGTPNSLHSLLFYAMCSFPSK